jgi:hypothetical protein
MRRAPHGRLRPKFWVAFVPNLHPVLAEGPAAIEAYATLWGIAERTEFTPQEGNVAQIAIIYAMLDVLVLAATKLISNHANHLAQRRLIRS